MYIIDRFSLICSYVFLYFDSHTIIVETKSYQFPRRNVFFFVVNHVISQEKKQYNQKRTLLLSTVNTVMFIISSVKQATIHEETPYGHIEIEF